MEEDGYKHERKITSIEENYLHRYEPTTYSYKRKFRCNSAELRLSFFSPGISGSLPRWITHDVSE